MKAFDTQLFKRILFYTKPYQWRFKGVIFWAIGLSVFAALRPYLLKNTVDDYIKTHDSQGLMFYILLFFKNTVSIIISHSLRCDVPTYCVALYKKVNACVRYERNLYLFDFV